VLFIGQAPGKTENVVGKPFEGQAGRLLDRIVHAALGAREPPVTWAMTNLVCCFPGAGEDGKDLQPDPEQIESCSSRLVEFVALCDPLLLVCVGSMARDWTDPLLKFSVKFHRNIPSIDIRHPASFLHAKVPESQLQQGIRRATAAVRTALEEVLARTV
jgi:DNA polymerase